MPLDSLLPVGLEPRNRVSASAIEELPSKGLSQATGRPIGVSLPAVAHPTPLAATQADQVKVVFPAKGQLHHALAYSTRVGRQNHLSHANFL